MSAIRERTTLCVIDLPRKLTSRRNLLAHFSKFGDVKELNLNKELQSAIVSFATHFDAQSAKTKGNIFEEKVLSIYWSETPRTSLDPRARDTSKRKLEERNAESESMWEEDDKETFGVEVVKSKRQIEEKKSTVEISSKQISKMSNLKRRLGPLTKHLEVSKSKIAASPKSPTKLGKLSAKTLGSLKKTLVTQATKRKLVRKEEDKKQSILKQKATSMLEDQPSKVLPSVSERVDLKTKLDLLDERDKKIREKIVPDSNIKTAVAMKGTCPDMCPERERIMRQYSLSVAAYETLPGKYDMDENKAVKEYTRSSADQDVPLPHDLRPEPVLSMTMNYLITNIINKVDNPDENKAVWYSFCWNRLRSIRKDIILQQLCDMETVKIVEQCARFHICCYDHMWGAEVSGFDDKINTQNLIDCLQTLKHMYEDLAKHGVTCPNEPEFYSYLILLKMKTGDVMWEYQQYSLSIQLSDEVQFAVKAYMAFKNNMYSNFFSLVRKASYLTSCLMQRYFEEVRTQALKTMLKAYCLPGKTVGLSSSFIMSTLKFDSQTNAKKFCEREEVDLKLDCEKNIPDVYTSDSSFLIKEKRLPIANAVVGECNPLPLYIPHQVHSSFDEFGQLKPVVSEEEDYSDDLETSFSEEDSSRVSSPESTPQQPMFKFNLSPKVSENSDISSSFSFLQGSQTSNESLAIVKPSPFNSNNHITPNLFFGSVENEQMRFDGDIEEDYDFDMMDEESEMEQEPHSSDSNSLFSQCVSPLKSTQPSIQSSFFQSPSTQMITSNAKIFMKNDVPAQMQTFSFTPSNEASSKSVFKGKSDSKIDGFITSTEVFIDDGTKNIEHNKQMLVNTESSMLPEIETAKPKTPQAIQEDKRKYFEEILKDEETLRMEKLLREKAEEEKLKMEELKREAMERQRRKIEEQKILQILKKDVSERLKAHNARKYARQWKEKVKRLKIKRADLPILVQLSVSDHLKSWGTINSLPANNVLQRMKLRKNIGTATSKLLRFGITDSCSYLGALLAETLARSAASSFKRGDIKPVYWKLAVSVPWVNTPSMEYCVFNQLLKRWCKQSFYKKSKSQLGSVESILSSLKIPVNISVHFSDDHQSSVNLQGMDAMVFVIISDLESEKECLQRLRSLVTRHAKNNEFSVAVMNVGGVKYERVLKMELEELHEQKLIADWKMSSWLNSTSVLQSLTFLAEHVNIAPHICATPLETLVDEVCEEFFDALNCGQHSSAELMEAVKNPNNVIGLYNTCLTKLEDILMSSKLKKYFNIAEEFKNCVLSGESGGVELFCGKQYSEAYKVQVSNKIDTLKLREFPTWPPESPDHLVEILKSYCNAIQCINVLPRIVRMVDPQEDADLGEQLQKAPWLNIVELCAQCTIRHCFTEGKSKKLTVLFNKNETASLIQQQWWLKLPIVTRPCK